MKFILPTVTLIRYTDDAHDLIDKAARTCTQNFEYYKDGLSYTENRNRLIKKLMQQEHLSVLEHVNYTFFIVCDRGTSHQLVRHRIASYSQESTRFAKHEELICVPPIQLRPHLPFFIQDFEYDKSFYELHDQSSSHIVNQSTTQTIQKRQQYYDFLQTLLTIEQYYINAKQTLSKDFLKGILPQCLKTSIVMTANAREWRHILKLRLSQKAHSEIRDIMCQCVEILKNTDDIVFDDISIYPKENV